MSKKNQNSGFEQSIERVKNSSFRMSAYSTMRKLLVGFILISIVNILFSQLFYTPKVHGINKKNSELLIKYNLLNNRIAAAESRLSEIAHRDNYVYRSLFGVDSINIDGVQTPYPDSKYEGLQNENYSEIMTSSWKKIDDFAKKLYQNSRSFDELQILAQNKESMSAAIPAIWPIDRTMLNSIGKFGMRQHPIYNQLIMHKGVDLGSKMGTPVFATGNGVIEKSVQGQAHSGYGQEILINHKYNYKTRYGHLSKRFVKAGDAVVRGQLIGEVGSTGGSVGPHLHYEVIYKGNVVDPINYFDQDMTNEEYTRLMEDMEATKFEKLDDLENGN